MEFMSPHFSSLKSRCLIKVKNLGSFLVIRETKMSFICFFQISFSLEVSFSAD